MAHLWWWFQELASARQPGFNGPLTLSWTDMRAWASCMQTAPEPWEFVALRQLDQLWLHAWHQRNRK